MRRKRSNGALAVVSAYSPGEIRRAIVSDDTALFQAIPGIGRKLAQRVVLELRERVAVLEVSGPPAAGAGDGHLMARDALVELGYTVAEAETRLAAVDPDLPPQERVVGAGPRRRCPPRWCCRTSCRRCPCRHRSRRCRPRRAAGRP